MQIIAFFHAKISKINGYFAERNRSYDQEREHQIDVGHILVEGTIQGGTHGQCRSVYTYRTLDTVPQIP